MFNPSSGAVTQSFWDRPPAGPPVAILSFERICLVASLFNDFVLVSSAFLKVARAHAASQHPIGPGMFLMVAAVAFVLLFPVVAMPYWLALAVSRARNGFAVFFLYLYTLAFVMAAMGAAKLHGLFSLHVCCELTELALMAAALVCLNLPEARAWRRPARAYD